MRQDRIQIMVTVTYGPTVIHDSFASTQKFTPEDVPEGVNGGLALMGERIGAMFDARFPQLSNGGIKPPDPPLG